MPDVPAVEKIESELSRQVAAMIGRNPEEAPPQTSLESLGIDSIRLVEILIFVEREYGVKLMEAGLTRDDLQNAASLARRIVRILQGTDPVPPAR